MTEKKENKAVDKEWTRVLGNPDNVIISDSLIARIDPYNLGEIENPVVIKPVCKFRFSTYTLSGEVVGFSNTAGQRSYTFSTPVTESSQLMNSADLVSFSMFAGQDELVTFSGDDITNLNFNVDVQNASLSLVTISFNENTP